jgi:SagB-type dehydrogenase family enzyme
LVSSRIDRVGEPAVRRERLTYREWSYSTADTQYLVVPEPVNEMQVYWRRRSRRQFDALSSRQLSELLWYSCKEIRGTRSPRWQQRPAPSAGGLHPLDVLLIRRDQAISVHLYNPGAHSLSLLVCDASLAEDFYDTVLKSVGGSGPATLLAFAAQPARTASKYLSYDSLIWRDSGALSTTMSFVAESLTLSCCTIGMTGEPFVSKLIGFESGVQGFGGCLAGTR